ncbi:hypothetical protein DY000_02054852 [Brassica cretica]|uniref:Peptidase M24 domain-containing protein n=1 Tax=Brassica cretica TaxID=69181 RepID=A0ABQ7AMQ0_BRACR|nr:hypothetical protein DY000_02054852 [Brassica cretica]
MASTVFLSSFSPSSSLQLRSSFNGEYVSSSRSFIGAAPFASSSLSLLSGQKNSYPQRKLHVSAKKVSGLEEAIRIRRVVAWRSSVAKRAEFKSDYTQISLTCGHLMRELEKTSKVRRNPPLRRGRVSPRLLVPDHIPRPPYVESGVLPDISPEFQIPGPEGIVKMRAACELAARVLNFAGTLVKPSVTTNEIDKAVHDMIVEAGAYPSPLGYGGFPKSVCTSVNECMCHGIPDSRQLQSGDIINIDVTVYLDGYHGDTSRTFFCGEVDEGFKRLVKVAFFFFLFIVLSMHLPSMSSLVAHLLSKFAGNDGPGQMVEGQTFTIEPILTIGTTECVTWPDNWTTLTADGGVAAQCEHTILITRTGAEILTKC